MRFFILISFLLFAVFALANPEPVPAPEPQLGDINDRLKDIGELLSGEFLSQVQSVVRHVDDLLDDKSTKVTKNLLMTAGPAITPELLKKVSGLLDNGSKLLMIAGPAITPELLKKVSGLLDNGSKLLTPDFVDQTKNLIKKAGKLLDTVDSLLGALGL
ncbi:hypothetical protein GX51_01177 [Blastomyces parvus]|uniref:Uncharacterized protein n=1 Tax=Blastomyces parvus TaxID=2060905 RepID=A0A2B7XHV2_9EURO|nr:hypothetical protein GX51_01177 [Blastomyces parvus]